MPLGYAFKVVGRTNGEIVKQLQEQGIKVLEPYETIEIGSTKDPYQGANLRFEEISENPGIQALIGKPHSQLWYDPTQERIKVLMYNLDPAKFKNTGQYRKAVISEMKRFLDSLGKKLPQVELELVDRIGWDKTEPLSEEDKKLFEEAREAYAAGIA